MKNNLIKTENYILIVSDEEIDIGQYVYCDFGYLDKVMDIIDGWVYNSLSLGKNPISHYKKIICHFPLNNSPILEGVKLLDDIELIPRELLNKDGSPMREYKSEIIEQLLKESESIKTKQTAVEWLFHKLWDEPKDKFTWYALLKQAKAMEEELALKHFKAGQDSMEKGGKCFDQYYNETYGKNNT